MGQMMGGIAEPAKPLDIERGWPYIPRMSVLRDDIDWSESIGRPIKCRDGTTLKTRSDVRAYILNLPDYKQHRSHWQPVAKALLARAPVKRVYGLLVMALGLDGAL